jgi:hypothetical protein
MFGCLFNEVIVHTVQCDESYVFTIKHTIK